MAKYEAHSDDNGLVYMVDATATIFRGYFGSKPMEGKDGIPTHAVFGFTQILMKFLRERRPSAVVLAFDAGPQSFRNEIYPEYKANRGAPPPDLAPQFDLCVKAGEALGFATVLVPGFEADDILATLAARGEAAGREIRVVTVDKDLCQLVTPKVQLLDPSRGTLTDVDGVKRRFGVAPERVPDWLALVGDTSDNIPGVPGVGARTATALLEHFDSLETIFANLDRMDEVKVRGRGTLGAKLEAAKDTAFLARRLATVTREVPIDMTPEDMAYSGAEPGAFESLFADWGFGWLASRVSTRG